MLKHLKLWPENEANLVELSFSRDENLIAIAADNDTVKLRQRNGSLIATYKDAIGKLLSAVLSPDSQTIAISNVEQVVQILRRDRLILG